MRSALANFPPMEPSREGRALLALRLDSIIDRQRAARRAQEAAKRAMKVSAAVALEMKRRQDNGETQKAIADALQVCANTVYRTLKQLSMGEFNRDGRNRGNSILTDEQRQQVIRLLKSGASHRGVAREFRVARQTVSAIWAKYKREMKAAA